MRITRITRRGFLKAGLCGAGVGFLACSRLPRLAEWVARADGGSARRDNFPITSIRPGDLPEFSGDRPTLAHKILWDKPAFIASKGGLPQAHETADVCIVGGGVGGLSAAYLLRDRQTVVLEQDYRFGGNAKGEQWDDLPYSIGAAYISPPDAGSGIYNVLKDMGLLNQYRIDYPAGDATVLENGRVIRHFWQGASDPRHAKDFRRIFATFKSIYDRHYPAIPPGDDGDVSTAEFNALDRMSFRAWMDLNLGATPSHVDEYLRNYCWSSFGGDYHEISAAHGLFFVAADLNGMAAFPGGNAAILQAICEKLSARESRCRLRPDFLVVDIRPSGDGVDVSYMDSKERLVTLHAQRCIVAAPKFAAGRLIDDVPTAQRVAWGKLDYRAYVVANILLEKKIQSQSFELFRITGDLRPSGKVTDLIFAGWAAMDRPDHSALTLYKAYPFDGGRKRLYTDDAYQQAKNEILDALPDFLNGIGVPLHDVRDIRLTRWGHALPLAKVGMFANGVVERIGQPIANRIFFANQDNLSNPSFDAAFHAAEEATRQLRSSF